VRSRGCSVEVSANVLATVSVNHLVHPLEAESIIKKDIEYLALSSDPPLSARQMRHLRQSYSQLAMWLGGNPYPRKEPALQLLGNKEDAPWVR
jgi:hypothetical protein